MSDRAALPDWPRWMSIERAASYFDVSVNTFRSWGIVPIERGRRVLYDRRHLDAYADRESGQPLEGGDLQKERQRVEDAFLARRRGG